MFETSSNSGAWCFCFMHAMYPCCYLAMLEVRLASFRAPQTRVYTHEHRKADADMTQAEGTLNEPIPWVRNQLNHIFNAAGSRAKTSILCTSLCTLPPAQS